MTASADLMRRRNHFLNRTERLEGNIGYLDGEHDLAIADATHSIRLDPRLALAHTNLGHALAAKGDVILAARSYRRGLTMDPDQTVAEETLEALRPRGFVTSSVTER